MLDAVNVADDNACVGKSTSKKAHQSEADGSIGPVQRQVCNQTERMGQHEAAFSANDVRNAPESDSADEEAEHEDGGRDGRGREEGLFADPVKSEDRKIKILTLKKTE